MSGSNSTSSIRTWIQVADLLCGNRYILSTFALWLATVSVPQWYLSASLARQRAYWLEAFEGLLGFNSDEANAMLPVPSRTSDALYLAYVRFGDRIAEDMCMSRDSGGNDPKFRSMMLLAGLKASCDAIRVIAPMSAEERYGLIRKGSALFRWVEGLRTRLRTDMSILQARSMDAAMAGFLEQVREARHYEATDFVPSHLRCEIPRDDKYGEWVDQYNVESQSQWGSTPSSSVEDDYVEEQRPSEHYLAAVTLTQMQYLQPRFYPSGP